METNNYYIVGYGKHSSSKIIPALENLNKRIFGIITSKSLQLDKNYILFKNLNEAIKSSTKNSIFIIATAPSMHYKQIQTILDAKRNIIVEKPIFISAKDAMNINNILLNKNLFVVEAMMYKHTLLYKRFFEYWLCFKDKITKLECKFLIPSIPKGTFRDELNIASSPLYDIGCYVISLLIDMGIILDNLEIKDVLFKHSRINKIIINRVINEVEFCLEFGLHNDYKNFVKLYTKNDQIKFEPFFYGRKAEKIITRYQTLQTKEEIIQDYNAFEMMFNISNHEWIFNQKKRFVNIIRVNKVLDSLSDQINKKFNYTKL